MYNSYITDVIVLHARCMISASPMYDLCIADVKSLHARCVFGTSLEYGANSGSFF